MTPLHTSWRSWQILFLLYTAKERSDLDLTGLSFQDWLSSSFCFLPQQQGRLLLPHYKLQRYAHLEISSFLKIPLSPLGLWCHLSSSRALLCSNVLSWRALRFGPRQRFWWNVRDSSPELCGWIQITARNESFLYSLPRAPETTCFLLNTNLLTSAAMRCC